MQRLSALTTSVAVMLTLIMATMPCGQADSAPPTLADMAAPTTCELCAVVAAEVELLVGGQPKSGVLISDALESVCAKIPEVYSAEHLDDKGDFDNRIPAQLIRAREDFSFDLDEQLDGLKAFGIALGEQLRGMGGKMGDPLGEVARTQKMCESFVDFAEDLFTAWYWKGDGGAELNVCSQGLQERCVFLDRAEARAVRVRALGELNEQKAERQKEILRQKEMADASDDEDAGSELVSEDVFKRIFQSEGERQEREEAQLREAQLREAQRAKAEKKNAKKKSNKKKNKKNASLIPNMGLSVGSLLEVTLLMFNAVSILHERRFLAKAGWGFDQLNAYSESSAKTRIIQIIHDVQKYAFIPLIILNMLTIIFKLVFG